MYSVQFILSIIVFSPNCFPKLLRLVTFPLLSSVWLHHTFVTQLDSFVTACILSWDPPTSWVMCFYVWLAYTKVPSCDFQFYGF